MLAGCNRSLLAASVLLVLLTTTATACAGAPAGDGADGGESTATARAERVTWVERTFSRESGECDTAGDAVPCTRVQFDWIDVVSAPGDGAAAAINAPTQEWLQRPVFEDDGGTPEQIADGLQRTHDELSEESSDYVLPWYVERTVSVVRDTPGVFALRMYEEMFTGGAHGIHTLLYRNYRPATGAVIALADVVVEGGLDELTRIAERVFREQEEIPPQTSLAEADFWFENDEFALPDNFLIDSTALAFYYNEYEISAYAFGPTELRVPHDAIEHLLRPDARIR